jgi:hypothetical protein
VPRRRRPGLLERFGDLASRHRPTVEINRDQNPPAHRMRQRSKHCLIRVLALLGFPFGHGGNLAWRLNVVKLVALRHPSSPEPSDTHLPQSFRHPSSPGYSVMCKHLHLVLRNRPDIAEQWSADEIALRRCRIFPPCHDGTGETVEPNDHDMASLTANSETLAELRESLADLSWFMGCLCERIARGANHEDGSSGRFWAGRFNYGSTGPDHGAAGAQSIELGGNCARLRSIVQAGGSAIGLARRRRGAGSTARRRLEPPLYRPPARRRAVKRHLDRSGFRSRRVTASRAQRAAWRRLDRASRSTTSRQVITHIRRLSSEARSQTASSRRERIPCSVAPAVEFMGV